MTRDETPTFHGEAYQPQGEVLVNAYDPTRGTRQKLIKTRIPV
jgi:hypothetical protein